MPVERGFGIGRPVPGPSGRLRHALPRHRDGWNAVTDQLVDLAKRLDA